MTALIPASESGALSAMRRASACTAAGQLRRRHHLVDHADLVGAPRVDGLAGEQQVPRVGGADDLHQLLAEREGDHQADPRQRHAEAGGLRGHPQVAVQGQLAAARDRVAVQRGDGGMPRALHPPQHLHHVALRIGLAAALLHLLEVHARAERGAGPPHHHHPHVAPLVERVEGRAQALQQRGVHRVALVGAVQGDGGDAGVDGDLDFVGHGAMVSSRPMPMFPGFTLPDELRRPRRADAALRPRRDRPARAADRSRRARPSPRRTSAAREQDQGGRAVGAGSAGGVRRRRARHLQHVRGARGDVAAPDGALQPGLWRLRPLSAASHLGAGARRRSRSTQCRPSARAGDTFFAITEPSGGSDPGRRHPDAGPSGAATAGC